MRAKIALLNPDPREGVLIPFNYNYFLSSAIMHALRIAEYDVHGREALYTFSLLFGGKPTKQGILVTESAYFVFSTPNVNELKAFLEGMLSIAELKIGNAKLALDYIEAIPSIYGREVRVKTLSPVTVYVKAEGKRTFLSPENQEFAETLSRIARKEYEEFTGKPGNVSVEDVEVKRRKKIALKNTSYTAYEIEATLRGDREAVEFAAEAGLGKKRKHGFGCLGQKSGPL